MIRYLKPDEFARCIPLYEEAFPEDSPQFRAYYFGTRLNGSRVLVKEDEEGRIISMAHLNPYSLMVLGVCVRADYIVAVATAAHCRRTGCMREVLTQVLMDQHAKASPFCFLMPASEAIYRPFGFAFISDSSGTVPDEDALSAAGFEKRQVHSDEGAFALAECVSEWLSARFGVYARRDGGYLKQLQAELESEAGSVFAWYGQEEREPAAIAAWWGRGQRTQRFFYSSAATWEKAVGKGKPLMMARITHLAKMLGLVKLCVDRPFERMEVPLYVKDPVIAQNGGLWRWRVYGEGGELTRAQPCGEVWQPDADTLVSSEVLSLEIGALTSWIFGYKGLEELLGYTPPFWTEYIALLGPVFLDEVV